MSSSAWLKPCTGALLLLLPSAHADWPVTIRTQHRPGTYWWCPGSAWDEESVQWNLEQLRAGGIGTVHVIPIYGAKGYEDRELPYLSDGWVDMLKFIVAEGAKRGLQVDMTTGTGWCFGGTMVSPSLGDQVAEYEPGAGVRIKPGMKVKRAGPGGQGPMLDPYSPAAMEAYLQPFTEAFGHVSRRPRAQYHDSFEYRGNWTPDLPTIFAQRRGYDLTPHLEALFTGTSETAARVKYDYRRTLAELHLEVIEQWTDWAHELGMLTRNEAHGAPANLLDVYAAADIPETEMFGSPDFPIPGFRHEEAWCRPGDTDPRVSMMAASAAHVAKLPGKQLVASESCTWMREHWHGTLGQIKLSMDLFLLAGVNHVFYHGSCYSPKDAPWPGFYFYASTKADWRNAIWRDMPALNEYLARCQSVLQSGGHDNDVLVYWPIHDLWMEPRGLDQKLAVHDPGWLSGQRIGEVSDELTRSGYAFDYLSDRMLEGLHWADGGLVAPGGRYRAILIPACRYMPPATMEHLAALADDGAVILFERALPRDVPGLAQQDSGRTRLDEAGKRFGRDAVVAGASAGLARAGIGREPMADAGLRFVRRRIGEGTWYFVANHTAKPHRAWTTLAAPCSSVTRHDPMTGQSNRLPFRSDGPAAQVYLEIEPGEALVLEASPRPSSAPAWDAMVPAGRPIPVEGAWQIDFMEGDPERPAGFTSQSLASWTEAPDERATAFAGTARYLIEIDVPDPASGDDWQLDLGDVRASARVRLNGREVGTLVALPFRLRVGPFLGPGRNLLEIEVTNTSANRMRDLDRRSGDWRIMKDIGIVNPHYQAFDPASWPVIPAGLLGPVSLTPLRSHEPGGNP